MKILTQSAVYIAILSLLTSCKTNGPCCERMALKPQKSYTIRMSELATEEIVIGDIPASFNLRIVLENDLSTNFFVNTEYFGVGKEKEDSVCSNSSRSYLYEYPIKAGDPRYHLRSVPFRSVLIGKCEFLSREDGGHHSRVAVFELPCKAVPKGESFLIFECYNCETKKLAFKSINLLRK